MTDCTCSNCIFMGDGFRYCYDCEKYTKMPSKEEFERKVAEAGKRLEEAKKDLGYESSTTL